MKRLVGMLKDESGAVTVDFVVLTAGVVVVAMLIAPLIRSPVSNLAESVGEGVNKARDYMDP